ncbi:MAG: MurR/RpiR family transcriptional regulator [Proteobacteria bacterium]|nr:MurR/RpiR family transcriptional regulator [Pseudomonadota bacterium]
MNVSESVVVPDPVLTRLADAMPGMSPQLRKAAQYVLDNPNDVGVSSIREIADVAAVSPNTLVRMARAVGFEGYEEFRHPFREALRAGRESFPDRARWLQSIARGGRHGPLYRDMAASSFDNVERLFAGTSAEEIKRAADCIVAARKTYVLGVGIGHALAQSFAYLARMAIEDAVAIPREGGVPIDDVARAGPGDVLLALTFKPYRTEVVEAVHAARDQGVTVVAISDARSSPILLAADHGFVVPTETPQFFTSTVAVMALLEAIMAFVVADADPAVVANIERFHRRRQDFGVYWTDGE